MRTSPRSVIISIQSTAIPGCPATRLEIFAFYHFIRPFFKTAALLKYLLYGLIALFYFVLFASSPAPAAYGRSPHPLAPTTWHVPADFPTIQQAIDARSDGDTLLVAAGVYSELVNFNGKDIILQSTNGPGDTSIDANGLGTAVTMGPHGQLLGFTISHGAAAFGAGLSVSGVGSVIKGNIFGQNTAYYGGTGAAIFGNGASPLIDGNIFLHNSCDGQSGASVVIFENSSSPLITNNVFVDNPCRAIVMAPQWGYTPHVINNTFVRNAAGIRLYALVDTSAHVYENNVIVSNTIGLDVDFGSNYPIWRNNLVFGNGTNYAGIPDQTGIAGNISADPLFLDPLQNDFELKIGSPAIDGGNNNMCPSNDLNGAARPQNGLCDIGAFETGLTSRKVVAKPSAWPGDPVTYTITLNNGLNSVLDSVLVTDSLPNTIAYLNNSFSATSGSYTFSDGMITWNGSISVTGAVTMTFSGTISPTAPGGHIIVNTAMVNGAGALVARSATVHIPPYMTFLPLVSRDFCGNFFDDFSNPASGWPVGDSSLALREYRDGEYRILSMAAGYFFLSRSPDCLRSTHSVEADARWAGAAGNSYGLLFGITNGFDQYYLFDVNTTVQQFRLLRRNSGGGFTTIVPATFSNAIQSGSASNHLKATRNSNLSTIKLEVNGVVLGTWTESSIGPLTGTGFVSSAGSSNPNADARFDNFLVTVLPDMSAANTVLAPSALPHVLTPASRAQMDAASNITNWR